MTDPYLTSNLYESIVWIHQYVIDVCKSVALSDLSDSQERAWSATRQCMEPTRPAKLWGACTTTAASPAAPAVSTNAPLCPLLPLERSVPVCSLDSHVKLTLPPERPCYLEFKAVSSSSGVCAGTQWFEDYLPVLLLFGYRVCQSPRHTKLSFFCSRSSLIQRKITFIIDCL